MHSTNDHPSDQWTLVASLRCLLNLPSSGSLEASESAPAGFLGAGHRGEPHEASAEPAPGSEPRGAQGAGRRAGGEVQ